MTLNVPAALPPGQSRPFDAAALPPGHLTRYDVNVPAALPPIKIPQSYGRMPAAEQTFANLIFVPKTHGGAVRGRGATGRISRRSGFFGTLIVEMALEIVVTDCDFDQNDDEVLVARTSKGGWRLHVAERIYGVRAGTDLLLWLVLGSMSPDQSSAKPTAGHNMRKRQKLRHDRTHPPPLPVWTTMVNFAVIRIGDHEHWNDDQCGSNGGNFLGCAKLVHLNSAKAAEDDCEAHRSLSGNSHYGEDLTELTAIIPITLRDHVADFSVPRPCTCLRDTAS